MALLPYSVRQVTQRSKGRRDRDRDRDRGDRDGELRELPGDAAPSRAERESVDVEDAMVDGEVDAEVAGETGDEMSAELVTAEGDDE
jgi:hypothetical protein